MIDRDTYGDALGEFEDQEMSVRERLHDDHDEDCCAHESVETPDGWGAFCRLCGETLE